MERVSIERRGGRYEYKREGVERASIERRGGRYEYKREGESIN